MARQCHLNTCPTGIATQREDLRAKFTGRPEHVINHLFLIAEDVREVLARLGARTVDEMVGRADLLAAPPDCALDLSLVLGRSSDAAPTRRVWARNGDVPAPAPQSGPIDNSRRTVGASLARGESRAYTGSAGQSFGALIDAGVELNPHGEAQDYVGKGMGGGTIVIRPPHGDAAIGPVLAGNTIAYGATGGRSFMAGRAGGRSWGRDSGAGVGVQGAGGHF